MNISHCVEGQVEVSKHSSKCPADGNKEGVCRRLSNCPWALAELQKGRRTKICLFAGPYPIVCCPGAAGAAGGGNSTSPKPPNKPTGTANREPTNQIGAIARKMCQEYASYVFAEEDSPVLMPITERVDKCAASADPLIVGGSQAKAMEFPHMALVGYGEEDNIDFACGGSLISPRFVLTAAHCLVYNDGVQPARWVLLGELDRSTTEDDAKPQRVEVAERFKHPQYAPPASYNDIALLRLAAEPEMNGYVRPACLFTEAELRAGEDKKTEVPVASGWGHTEWAGDPSNHLMKVALRLTEEDKCAKAYASASKKKLPRGVLHESQLCAGGSGKDTCQGDSGGPLQVSTRNYSRTATEPYCMYKVMGITSFGQACGFNAPGVYTRVYHYVPWIEKIVWP